MQKTLVAAVVGLAFSVSSFAAHANDDHKKDEKHEKEEKHDKKEEKKDSKKH